MRGAWIVGGRKGVGVDLGEHADREIRINTTANRLARSTIEGTRLGKNRLVIVKKDGRPVAESPDGQSYSSDTSAEPPSSPPPISSGRAISPLRAFCRMTASISPMRSGF